MRPCASIVVCWLGASDAALYGWCGAGIVAAVVLMLGFVPLPCLVFLWIDYLSLSIAGQLFYQFQWDILLLEAGFVAIFLSPWPSAIGIAPTATTAPSPLREPSHRGPTSRQSRFCP